MTCSDAVQQGAAPQVAKKQLAGVTRDKTIDELLLAATGHQALVFAKLQQFCISERGQIPHKRRAPRQHGAAPVAVAGQVKHHRNRRTGGGSSQPQPHESARYGGVGVVPEQASRYVRLKKLKTRNAYEG